MSQVPPPIMKNYQQSFHPLSMAFSRFLSSKMVVISAKKSKKNGKIPPDISAEMEPMMSWILYDGVV